jgi:hypothetical protein
MPCRGTCAQYKSKARYSETSKRCQVCDLFVNWSGARCPCCSFILRSKARNPRRSAVAGRHGRHANAGQEEEVTVRYAV